MMFGVCGLAQWWVGGFCPNACRVLLFTPPPTTEQMHATTRFFFSHTPLPYETGGHRTVPKSLWIKKEFRARWRLSWNDSPVLDLAYLAKKRISPWGIQTLNPQCLNIFQWPTFVSYFKSLGWLLKLRFKACHKVNMSTGYVSLSFIFHRASQHVITWTHQYLSPCKF